MAVAPRRASLRATPGANHAIGLVGLTNVADGGLEVGLKRGLVLGYVQVADAAEVQGVLISMTSIACTEVTNSLRFEDLIGG